MLYFTTMFFFTGKLDIHRDEHMQSGENKKQNTHIQPAIANLTHRLNTALSCLYF